METICRIWRIKKPTGQMLRQLRIYREDPELNYTNKGMELTLRYYYDLLDNKPDEDHGVGIIPHHYDKAKKQYIRQLKIKQSAEKKLGENRVEREVYVNTKPRNKKRDIDIDSL